MFSFTTGRPIAAIAGGPYDKRVLRVTEETAEPSREIAPPRPARAPHMTMVMRAREAIAERDPDEFEEYDEETDEDEETDDEEPAGEDIDAVLEPADFKYYMAKYKAMNVRDRECLKRALVGQHEPDDPRLIPMWQRASATIQEKLKKQFDPQAGEMVVLPDEKPERVYVAGQSGSGKSCWAALYMNEYARMFPRNRIVLITTHENEQAYRHIPHVEIKADETLAENPPNVTDLKNALVVFDDCDNISIKRVGEAMRRFNDDLIANGRKYGVHVMTLQHQLTNYKDTRNLLNEAQRVVFFNTATHYHTGRYLKTYVGLDNQQIKRIHGVKSRWTMIDLGVIKHVVHQNGAFIL